MMIRFGTPITKENFVFWNWWGERTLDSLNVEERCEVPDWLPDEDDLGEIEASRPGRKRAKPAG
jgi:hypothetical protein